MVISEGDDDDGDDLMLTQCNRSSAYHGPGMEGGSLDACMEDYHLILIQLFA